MYTLATLLALLPPMVFASPVSNDEVKRIDDIFVGTATQYSPSPFIPGSCGDLNSPYDYVVGIASAAYGTGAPCGHKITIGNEKTLATVDAIVVNDCVTCEYAGDMQITQAIATQLNSGETPGPLTTFVVIWYFTS